MDCGGLAPLLRILTVDRSRGSHLCMCMEAHTYACAWRLTPMHMHGGSHLCMCMEAPTYAYASSRLCICILPPCIRILLPPASYFLPQVDSVREGIASGPVQQVQEMAALAMAEVAQGPSPEPSSYFPPPISYFLPPTSYHLLPTAYRLLPTAYRLLPTAYFLPPTSYLLPPTS